MAKFAKCANGVAERPRDDLGMGHEQPESGLEVLDHLELFNSTVECSKILGISQSTCSRRYRAYSKQFGLEFDRIGDSYQATNNHDVLQSLRQAAQKLRARSGQPRLCIGWQLGAIAQEGFLTKGNLIPVRPMNSWKLLSMLEQRLIDVAVTGLMEFESLLPEPLSRLRSRRVPLSATMLCVPICRWDLLLLAYQEHPLRTRRIIGIDDIAQYPSPSLAMGMAPHLMGQLQNHSLATKHSGLFEYDEGRWEGCAADGVSLSYGAPHRLFSLERQYKIQPVPYNLELSECIGIVGHRDVLCDPGFPQVFQGLLGEVVRSIGRSTQAVRWIT